MYLRSMKSFAQKKIILFDGVCNLCNASVRFVLKHDKKNQFLFASLQSDAASKLLLQLNEKNIPLDTVIFIDRGVVYKKSSAILHIVKHFNLFYKSLYLFIIVPKFIRDALYDLVAKHRYQWFGKKDFCALELDKNKNRFILR